MGLFLSMSCVINCGEAAAVGALREFAEERNGTLKTATLNAFDDGCLIVSAGKTGVTVSYPPDFFDWDDASQFLSERLQKSVFSFHIHDEDLWMYVLFENGNVADQFNPIPDYWEELDADERDAWRGNPSEVARLLPQATVEDIARYLVQWGDEVFESDIRTNAYQSDEFFYGDDWQLLDFMKKLGLDFPLKDLKVERGMTYEFKCDATDAY